MGIRNSGRLTRRNFEFRISISVLLLCLGGCASPGEPVERKPPVPTAIQDLSAEQLGNTVVLTFTLPQETIDRRPLKQTPAIEIYRSFSEGNAAVPSPAKASSPSLLVTIPSALVSHYVERGGIRYSDSLKPEDFAAQPNEVASYIVRTRASQKKSSPDSNVITLRVYPAPEEIGDLKASVSHSMVELAWTPPQKTLVGPIQAIKSYEIYRADLPTQATGSQLSQEPRRQTQPVGAGAQTKSSQPPPLRKIGEGESPRYEDSQVEFDRTYQYTVRSVVEYPNGPVQLESSESNLVTITVRDTVPPSVPQGLVTVFVPAEGDTTSHLELSWAINPETDVAGYNVYRTEREDELGTRLNPELLPAPAFRDMSTAVGHRYFYSVTAVDRSGNESRPSAAVSGEVPAEGKPEP